MTKQGVSELEDLSIEIYDLKKKKEKKANT